MDGNRRWSTQNSESLLTAYRKGVDVLCNISSELANNPNVNELSVYAYSIENMHRPEHERIVVNTVLKESLNEKSEFFIKNNIKVKMVGNKEFLSKGLYNQISKIESQTENCQALKLNICFYYTGKWEISNVVSNFIHQHKDLIHNENIPLSKIESYLNENLVKDVDLCIRSSGEQRLSGFLIWSNAYAEFMYSNTLWPDFSVKELNDMIHLFNTRTRRFGK